MKSPSRGIFPFVHGCTLTDVTLCFVDKYSRFINKIALVNVVIWKKIKYINSSQKCGLMFMDEVFS